MSEQFKQLKHLLSEVGINLSDNQLSAVYEAVKIVDHGNVLYSDVITFMENHAPKKEKQDGILMREFHNMHSNLQGHYEGQSER